MIKAVTFDLWDTLIRDDSDEPERAARGLPSKKAARRQLLWEALEAAAPIERARVDLAYDVADAAFNHVWHTQSVTWTIAQRLRIVLEGLGRDLPKAAFAALVAAHEDMELEIPPDPVEGAREALAALAGRYRLAVVSDAIVTPGRKLRRLLEIHDLAQYFSAFAFSDEVGRSKPHRAMFETAAQGLGVALPEIVHVGDREHNDVEGPHALGMKAVLFVGARDRGSDRTRADAVCLDSAALPDAIARLDEARVAT